MKKEEIVIRINYSTFRKLRRIFYARKNESVSKYFERLVEYIKENNSI